MKAPTRTTFRWYRISYFLKTLWLTTSSLVTCSKTPSCQRKKKVSEEVYHVCPKNLSNFSGGFRIKADSLMCIISSEYHISEKAIKPRNQEGCFRKFQQPTYSILGQDNGQKKNHYHILTQFIQYRVYKGFCCCCCTETSTVESTILSLSDSSLI